jgi:hypothetical protein
MKWINARFPDDLHAEIANAADAEERPIGSWLRIAAKEKLASTNTSDGSPLQRVWMKHQALWRDADKTPADRWQQLGIWLDDQLRYGESNDAPSPPSTPTSDGSPESTSAAEEIDG